VDPLLWEAWQPAVEVRCMPCFYCCVCEFELLLQQVLFPLVDPLLWEAWQPAVQVRCMTE
jgi:hypothetical protein